MKSSPRDTFPRVLMVLIAKVKAEDPVNLLIRAEFGSWPRERLAQIHATAETSGRGEFCGSTYQLQAEDRFLGNLFLRLRPVLYTMVTADKIVENGGAAPRCVRRRRWNAIKRRIGNWLISTGLWEVVFRVRASASLLRFIEEFKPDLIYCQGYSLGFTCLPLLISRKVKVPLCFQTTDDWPHRLYRRSPVGWLLRRKARELIVSAKVRLAFGERMRQDYERRYGVPFEVTYHIDDSSRFKTTSEPLGACLRIVYTGSLGHRRHEAIVDLLMAIRRMPDLARGIKIFAYTSGMPKGLPLTILEAPEVKIMPLPAHEQLPGVLAGADVLLLPESFNEPREAIALSLSTKAHLYMMSRRPILVYGPAYSGTVAYAQKEGWGFIITERNPESIRQILLEIIEGGERVVEKRLNADRCVRSYHDLEEGRSRFLRLVGNTLS